MVIISGNTKLIFNLKQDAKRYFHEGVRNKYLFMLWLIINPGSRASIIYRIQQTFQSRSGIFFWFISILISSLNQFICGIEICVGCEIGPGMKILHPTGIVMGSGVIAGSNLTIAQCVTIGLRNPLQNDGIYPKLENDVFIGANSVILGSITISNKSIIPALSLIKTNL
jgi:serine O-acetyltransferase